MAHTGEEITLGPVCFFSLDFRFLKLGGEPLHLGNIHKKTDQSACSSIGELEAGNPVHKVVGLCIGKIELQCVVAAPTISQQLFIFGQDSVSFLFRQIGQLRDAFPLDVLPGRAECLFICPVAPNIMSLWVFDEDGVVKLLEGESADGVSK